MEEKKGKKKRSRKGMIVWGLAGVCLAVILAVPVRLAVQKLLTPEIPLRDRSWDEWEWDGRTLWKEEWYDGEGNLIQYYLYDFRKGHDVTEFSMDRISNWENWMELEPDDGYVTTSEDGYEQKAEEYSLSPKWGWRSYGHLIIGYDGEGKKMYEYFLESDGTIIDVKKPVRDEKGNIVGYKDWHRYWPDSSEASASISKVIYEYNENGECIIEKSYIGAELYNYIQYSYENGNCVREEEYMEDSLDSYVIYTYEGDILVRADYWKNGGKERECEGIYEYKDGLLMARYGYKEDGSLIGFKRYYYK